MISTDKAFNLLFQINHIEIVKVIQLYLDSSTKLIKEANIFHSCDRNGVPGNREPVIHTSLRRRIYWDELKRLYIPNAKLVTYSSQNNQPMIQTSMDMTTKIFGEFHDPITMSKMVIEFRTPLEIRSI